MNNAKWFCPLPFYHVYSNSNGKWAACCLSRCPGNNTRDTSLMEWYNSDHMNNLRDEMLGLSDSDTNIKRYCFKCLDQEKNEGTSSRIKWNNKLKGEIKKGVEDTVKEYVTTGEINFLSQERFLDLKLRIFGNLCNLSCFMCWPQNSSTRTKDVKKMKNLLWKELWIDNSVDDFYVKGKSSIKEETSDSFIKTISEIKQFAANISSVKITGGEPLMLDSHYQLLDMLIESGHAKHIKLKYQTNLTKFDRGKNNFLDYMKKFSNVHISASIDSYDEYDEYIRKGTDAKLVEENLKKITQLNNVELLITSTITNLSVLRLKEFYKKYQQYDIDSFILTGPDMLNIKHLPDEIKQQLIDDLKDIANLKEYDSIKNMLLQPRDEKKFQQALQYCLDTDKLYGRNQGLFELWPELKKYKE